MLKEYQKEIAPGVILVSADYDDEVVGDKRVYGAYTVVLKNKGALKLLFFLPKIEAPKDEKPDWERAEKELIEYLKRRFGEV